MSRSLPVLHARADASPYEVVGFLAEGGMAEVFLGQIPGPRPELVVLKRLKPDHEADPEFVRMFLDEARVMRLVADHPNIVTFYGDGVLDGSHFMALELLEGLTLEQVLAGARRQRRPVPVPIVLRILVGALEGLAHAHAATDEHGAPLGVVHRDISPQNIVLTWTGRPTLLDFGVALSRGRRQHTRAGYVKGKPTYMAPEQLKLLPADPRADQFALAVVAYLLLSLEHPFDRLGGDALQAALDLTPASLTELVPGFPRAISDIVDRALAKSPDDRFADARAMRDAISAAGPRPASREEAARYLAALAPKQRLDHRLSRQPSLPADESWHDDETPSPDARHLLEVFSRLYEPPATGPLPRFGLADVFSDDPEGSMARRLAQPAAQKALPPPSSIEPEPTLEPAPEGSPASPVAPPADPDLPPLVPSVSRRALHLGLVAAAALGLAVGVAIRGSGAPSLAPQLSLHTEPPGATVTLDGVPVTGRTPLVGQRAPGPEATVEFSMPGYAPCRVQLAASPAPTRAVHCRLRPAP